MRLSKRCSGAAHCNVLKLESHRLTGCARAKYCAGAYSYAFQFPRQQTSETGLEPRHPADQSSRAGSGEGRVLFGTGTAEKPSPTAQGRPEAAAARAAHAIAMGDPASFTAISARAPLSDVLESDSGSACGSMRAASGITPLGTGLDDRSTSGVKRAGVIDPLSPPRLSLLLGQ